MSNKNKQVAKNEASSMNLIIGVLVAAIVIIVAVGIVLAVQMLGGNDTPKREVYETKDYKETTQVTEYVKITVKDHGDIVVKLRPDVAPITVANFQKLVGEKFYDGLTFHRVRSGFMIQGGDPDGDGTGGSPDKIKGEFSANGVQNDLSHKRGVISMARSNAMDSASSQFFICHDDASSSLDGKYAAFGEVVDGMVVVDTVAAVEVTYNARGEKSVPVEKVIIEKACFVEKK